MFEALFKSAFDRGGGGDGGVVWWWVVSGSGTGVQNLKGL